MSDTAAGWAANNPFLAEGWEAIETDTGRRKIGDGKTRYSSLPYLDYTGGLGAPVASAAALVPSGGVFHVTGTVNITSITSNGTLPGTRITIIFDGVLTFTDGNNLKLAGNFVTTADDTITLVYDGVNWYETSRSVN